MIKEVNTGNDKEYRRRLYSFLCAQTRAEEVCCQCGARVAQRAGKDKLFPTRLKIIAGNGECYET